MEIFDTQLIYFIFALILGFIIGILLKKSSAEKSIKNRLQNLEKEFYASRDRLDIKSNQFFDTKNKFQINKDLLNAQNTIEKRTKNSINDYKKKISSLQEANDNLENQLTYLQKEIKKFENKIDSFKGDYNKINSIIREYENLKLEEENLLLRIQEYEGNIKKFTDNKLSLTTKLFTSKKTISSLAHEIKLLSSKDSELKRQKHILRNKNYSYIDNEYEDVKTKMLNYKYKVKEVEEQIKSGLKISKEEINHFISKNESKRLIDKLFLKIFNTNDKIGIL